MEYDSIKRPFVAIGQHGSLLGGLLFLGRLFKGFSAWAGLLVGFLFLTGCTGQDSVSNANPEKVVVVYTALDAPFSAPNFALFTEKTKIRVLSKYDTESTKTVGLTQAIIAERERPRCDLFWNNEILNTLRLEKQGLLRAYFPPVAESYPKLVRSPKGTWHGFAARARVLIVNTHLVAEGRRPNTIEALIDLQWQDRCGIAKPLFGTTATHAACLFAAWGDERAIRFFKQVKRNARILSGNKRVAEAVGAGQLAFGLTDTDDAIIELEKGSPVVIIYPDQKEGELGTLFIPNTLALIKGSKHPRNAEKLVDYLLSPEVEKRLAEGGSAQIPLNSKTVAKVRVKTPEMVRPMKIDFYKAVDKWERASRFLLEEFSRAK